MFAGGLLELLGFKKQMTFHEALERSKQREMFQKRSRGHSRKKHHHGAR